LLSFLLFRSDNKRTAVTDQTKAGRADLSRAVIVVKIAATGFADIARHENDSSFFKIYARIEYRPFGSKTLAKRFFFIRARKLKRAECLFYGWLGKELRIS
jgi:hypothetical protein